MNMCPAGRHDMDVAGVKRRSDRGPSAKPVCRGCDSDGMRKRRQAANDDSWRLPEVYDLDTRELIVDEIAIERAVSGERAEGPWITRTEAIQAFQIMDRRGFEYSEIAERIGCDPRTVERWAVGEYTPAQQVRRKQNTVAELSPDQLARKRARDAERSRERRAALKEAALAGERMSLIAS
jgi:ribosome-binding protein aMBF1 (putative translation factor)